MANEATVRSSLQILNGLQEYQSRPTVFQADMSAVGGPTPGEVSVPTDGVDISLATLTQPGLCRIMNLDSSNRIEYGIRDTVNNLFHAIGEVLPGETFVLRLSRYLQQELVGTGTTPSGTPTTFHFKADVAACKVLVEAFER